MDTLSLLIGLVQVATTIMKKEPLAEKIAPWLDVIELGTTLAERGEEGLEDLRAFKIIVENHAAAGTVPDADERAKMRAESDHYHAALQALKGDPDPVG